MLKIAGNIVMNMLIYNNLDFIRKSKLKTLIRFPEKSPIIARHLLPEHYKYRGVRRGISITTLPGRFLLELFLEVLPTFLFDPRKRSF